MLVQPGLGRRGSRDTADSGWALTDAIRPLVPRVAALGRVRAAKWATLAAVVALAVAAPLAVSAPDQVSLTNITLTAMMCLSLVVLTGYAGNVSLGQFAFVGIGAAAGGRLHQLGVPHLPAAVLVALIGAAIATLIGLPALRMRGLFLSVATLGFALATSSWLFYQDWFVHVDEQTGTSLQLPRPKFLGIDFNDERPYYWLCLAVLLGTSWFVYRIRHVGLGRSMIAVRDNELSAASMAQSPRRVKLTAFAISGAIASLAGFLYGGLLINFSSNPGSTFAPSESLSLVVTAVFGGITSVTGAVLGSLWIVGIPRILGSDYALFSSGFAVVLILLLLPSGLATIVFRLRDRVVAKLVPAAAPVSTPVPASAAPLLAARPIGDRTALRATAPIEAIDVSVRFGGLQALSSVSIAASRGEILGLMGPNGAGKTTLFDVLSGNLQPDTGRVRLHGSDVTELSPHRRARLGLGRTYQAARLFAELTTAESVMVALDQERRATTIGASVCARPATPALERRQRSNALDILELVGIAEFADRPVSQLPTGTRRVAELACVVALQPNVLLLDEPTAGFTPREIAAFLDHVHRVREMLGATIVMIDHDIHVMHDLVDRLYVLATGIVIAEGPPSVLRTDEAVRDVYTGAA
jgi:ABC-type branched-subunit amino acid transport system ATPase component/ABC-type branched-subunit amino acid transport system permease subunit